MSQASEWVRTHAEWLRAQPEMPAPVMLLLGPGRSVTISCHRDGKVHLSSPLVVDEDISPSDLCAWARAILATFGEGPSA